VARGDRQDVLEVAGGVSVKFVDRWKVQRSLRDYPLYAQPFARSTPVLSRQEMDSNYQHFEAQKAARLEHLASYLAGFSVQLVLVPEAIPPLARWIDRYGGHLVPAAAATRITAPPEVSSSLCCGEPGWVGDHRGLNVINDIAIFAGEYIISRQKGGHWAMWYGDGEKRDRDTGVFGHPCIFGLRHFGPEHRYSMLMEILENCYFAQGRLDGKILVWPQQPDNLVRRLSYLAAEPEPAVSASPKGRKSRETRGALVQRNGVKIYNAFKGRQSMSFWYALEPNCQVEGSDRVSTSDACLGNIGRTSSSRTGIDTTSVWVYRNCSAFSPRSIGNERRIWSRSKERSMTVMTSRRRRAETMVSSCTASFDQ
jgi:hypothetical protein